MYRTVSAVTLARPRAASLTCISLPILLAVTFREEATMEKLKLELDDLEVESFDAAAEPELRGTVEANGIPYSEQGTCSCPRWCTLAETCPHSCYILETCEPDVCW
jgi:hypothetical protein